GRGDRRAAARCGRDDRAGCRVRAPGARHRPRQRPRPPLLLSARDAGAGVALQPPAGAARWSRPLEPPAGAARWSRDEASAMTMILQILVSPRPEAWSRRFA